MFECETESGSKASGTAFQNLSSVSGSQHLTQRSFESISQPSKAEVTRDYIYYTMEETQKHVMEVNLRLGHLESKVNGEAKKQRRRMNMKLRAGGESV